MKKILIFLVLFALCQMATADTSKITKVYIANMKPCVIIEESEGRYTPASVTGFEIDLWNKVGKELKAQQVIGDWEFVPVSWNELEENIKSGNADVACAGLTLRSYRMDWAEFSLPTMNSGLGIMKLKKDVGFIGGLVIMCEALKGPVIFFASFILIFAFIIWLLERDNDPDNDDNGISDAFFPGIFEAIYFCIVTCSTVGYGDFAPKKWRTRTITGVLIIVGLIAFGNFLSLVSVARIQNITGGIQGPEDLKGKVVLTQKGTTSVDYVKKLGASPKKVDDIDSACDYLLLGRGDAVVYDYPVLLNYVKENSDKVELVDGMFDDQYYGYFFPKGSELKRVVDVILLKFYEDGTYQDLYKKWF